MNNKLASEIKTYVPIMLRGLSDEKIFNEYVADFKKASISRVYLCPCGCTDSEDTKKQNEELLRRSIPKFEAEGFEVGVWISSLGHGGNVLSKEEACHTPYQFVMNAEGKVCQGNYCPLDNGFAESLCDWVKRIALCGAKLVMLDDDYRMSFRAGEPYCFCDKHMALVGKYLGREITRDELRDVLTGEPDSRRDAWLKAQGEGLIELAKKLRSTLDGVAPETRLGHCAVLSTWDTDGADSIELSKAFAGSTRPFLRLIGAPYWLAIRGFGVKTLSTIIEYERLQRSWCDGEDIELFAEGDAYPRPRYATPSSYLELFEAGLLASGGFEAVLKYMCDYTSLPSFEKGYLERHNRNSGRRKWIESNFNGKETIGLRVFEPMKTAAKACLPKSLGTRYIPSSLRIAAFNSVPTKFEGEGINIVFGDSAIFADDSQFENGAIIDAKAAQILTKRGFDIGAEAFGEEIVPSKETFLGNIGDFVDVSGHYICITPKAGAEILSTVTYKNSEYPGAYLYQNDKKQRFLVYSFDAQAAAGDGSLKEFNTLSGYYRQEQLVSALTHLLPSEPQVYSLGNPYLYLIAKKDEKSLSVAVINAFPDDAISPKIHIPEGYTSVEGCECEASVSGNSVTLSDIQAYGFAAFTVKK